MSEPQRLQQGVFAEYLRLGRFRYVVAVSDEIERSKRRRGAEAEEIVRAVLREPIQPL